MAVTFCVNFFTSKPHYGDMMYGMIVPTVPDGSVLAALGLIGAVIMPHNLYLHSSLVLTRKIDVKNKNAINEANIYNLLESACSLFVSFIISTAVISTFASYIIHTE